MKSPIRNKWLALFAVLLILLGAERIVEWYIFGHTRAQGPSLPKAKGTHALVTGVVIVVLGAWAAFASTREKTKRSTPTQAPEDTSQLNRES